MIKIFGSSKSKKTLKSICIFTPHGHTFTFKNVEIVCDNETTLVFTHRAMSDGNLKTGTFQKNMICGYSKY